MRMNQLTPYQPAPLDSSSLLAQLIPDKIIDSLDNRIYWFKRGPKKGTDFAMLIITRGKNTFRLQYYPKEGEPQFAKDLEMSQLAAAIEDLIGAGFPVRRTISQGVPDKRGAPVLTENKRVQFLPP